MNNIEEAILGNLNMKTAVNREVLKAAVMRQITCPRSGKVLDIRSAVYIHVSTPNGASAGEVMDGSVWDEIKENLTATCAENNIDLDEVIDGRVVNGKSKRKGK